MKRNYEIVLMFGLSFEEQIADMVDRYKKLVSDSEGGVIHRFEDWGRLNLAYHINKQKKAHYFLMNVECSPTIIAEFKKLFRFNDAILRHLILQVDEPIKEKSTMLKNLSEKQARQENFERQKREERSERFDRAERAEKVEKTEVADEQK